MSRKSVARLIGLVLLIVAAGAFVTACTTVEATGERRLNLVSEDQEIQMGREADRQIVAAMGLYADPGCRAT